MDSIYDCMLRVMRRVWVKERGLSNFGQLGPLHCSPSSNALISFSTRVPTGRVIFEIGGSPIREELARDGPCLFFITPKLLSETLLHVVLRQAAAKLPTKMEFISKSSPPRLGNLLITPPKPIVDAQPENVVDPAIILDSTTRSPQSIAGSS